jgi:intein/homing endonuclease
MIDNDLAQILFANKKLCEFSREYGIGLKNMSRYRNCTRSIPIKLFQRIAQNSPIRMEEFQGKMRIKINRMGKYVKIGPVINIDEKWVYISELIKGDGYIPSTYWYIVFVNKNENLIHIVKNFFLSLGLPEKQVDIRRRSDATFLTVRSSPIAYILNGILGVPVGKKGEIGIKKFVMNDKILSVAAVRGAFDAEGAATFTGSRRISITSNSQTWLLYLSKILKNLGIKSTIYEERKGRKKPIYRLFVQHIINIRRFYEIVQPQHTQRSRKLREIIETYSKPYFGVGYLRKPILLSIKSGNTRRSKIAEDISQNPITVGNNIKWLRKRGLIRPSKMVYTNNGGFYEYILTEMGLKYLRDDTLSFFD